MGFEIVLALLVGGGLIALLGDLSDDDTAEATDRGTEADEAVRLTDGPDTFSSAEGDDLVEGGNGGDDINAGPGDDTVLGGRGYDVIVGGNGDDSLEGENGFDVVLGGNGNDTVDGGNGIDVLFGEGGDDIIDGGAWDDLIVGGAGADSLTGGDGADLLEGGFVTDRPISFEEAISIGAVVRNSGDEVEDIDEVDGPVVAALDDGAPDTLDGGAGPDWLILGAGDVGTGGDGADDFSVLSGALSASPGAPSVITDYDDTKDQLELTYAEGTPPPAVTVAAYAGGTEVFADGVVVAQLEGVNVSDIDASDIFVLEVSTT